MKLSKGVLEKNYCFSHCNINVHEKLKDKRVFLNLFYEVKLLVGTFLSIMEIKMTDFVFSRKIFFQQSFLSKFINFTAFVYGEKFLNEKKILLGEL